MEKNVRSKKMLSLLMIFTMIVQMLGYTPRAYADGEKTELDISKGSIVIGDGRVTGYNSDGEEVTDPNSNGYIIIGTTDSNSVTVEGGTHEIVLNNVSITSSSAFAISGGVTVTLTLEGTNTLTSTDDGCAGLGVEDGSNLIISADSVGSLTVTGGANAAGIGGAAGSACGSVAINGGTVTVKESQGAAIGGGYDEGTSTCSGAGTFTASGNAFIVAESSGEYAIQDTSNLDSWSGVILQKTGTSNGTGAVYGDAVTLQQDAQVPADYVLTVASGQSITLASGVTLTNSGSIEGGSEEGSGGFIYVGNGFFVQADSATVTDVELNYGRSIDAPTASKVLDTSITLNEVTVATGGTVSYGYLTDASGVVDDVTNWQEGLTFADLTAATAYYFYAKVSANDPYPESMSDAMPITTKSTLFSVELVDGNWDAVESGSESKTVTYKVSVEESMRDSLTSLAASLSSNDSGLFAVGTQIDLTAIQSTGESTFTITFDASQAAASEDAYTVTLEVVPEGNDDLQTWSADISQTVGKKILDASAFVFTPPTDVNDGDVDSTLQWFGGFYTAQVTLNEAQGISSEDVGEITVYYRKEGESDWTTGGAKDAGTYYVAIDVAGGENYASLEKLSNEKDWNFTIASGISIISTLTKKYDGQPVKDIKFLTNINEEEMGDTTITFYKKNDSGVYVEMSKDVYPTEVGEYQVKIVIEGTDNYNRLDEKTQNFEILQTNVIVKINDYNADKVYDKKPITKLTSDNYEVTTLTGDAVEDATVTITYRKIDAAEDEATEDETNIVDAGVYVVEVSVAATTSYEGAKALAIVTISKVDITVKIDSEKIKDKEYDNTQVSFEEGMYTIEGVLPDDDLKDSVTIWYKEANADDSEYDLVAPKNAGTYKVKVSVAESGNYGEGSAEAVFSITQAIGTIDIVNAKNLSKMYDGDPTTDPIYVTPMAGVPTFSYKVAGPQEQYTSDKPVNVGTYLLKAEMVDAGGNYTDAEAIVDIVITKAYIVLEVSAAWDGTSVLTKDHINVIGTDSDASTLKESLKIEYKLASEGDDAYTEELPTAAGRYMVRVSLEESENYGSAVITSDFLVTGGDNQSGKLQIYDMTSDNPETPVAGDLSVTKVYDGLSIDQAFFSKYKVDTEGTGTPKYEYKLSSDADTAYSSQAPVNAGEYTIRISLIPNNGFGTVDSRICNVTVKKADVSLSIYGWKYEE